MSIAKRFLKWLQQGASNLLEHKPHAHQEPVLYIATDSSRLKVGDSIFCGYIVSITEPDVYTGERLVRAGYGNHDITTFLVQETEQLAVRVPNPEYRP